MPFPLVVVEVPAQDRAAPETAALLEACTSGLGSGRCELAEPQNARAVSAVAIVSWRDAERLSALVEVARVQQTGEGWRSEELRFKTEDRRIERFRTLGLAIATLFREASLPQSSEATAAATPTPALSGKKPPVSAPGEGAKLPQANFPPTKAEPRKLNEPEQTSSSTSAGKHNAPHHAQAWGTAGVLVAYDPTLRNWRYGGQLGLAAGASGFPMFVSALGSYATGPALGEVALRWATLGGGCGLRFTLTPRVELRGAAHGLAVDISGQASELGRVSSQNVWVPGVGLELELVLHAGGALSGTIAAQVQQLAANVPIREHDRLIGTAGRTTLGVTLTLELRVLGQPGGAD